MKAFLVAHTHWDREWYRTFESFRARLVDTVDAVLDLCAADPGFRFLLDGQTIVLEDYAAIRPERRKELEDAVRAGRIAIGPWWVQPDSLLPSGEAHVRNLLEGRRAGAAFGPVSNVAHTPDAFGHPAQYPQLFAGFGLGAFVYWRGNPNELAGFPAEYRWLAPDGSSVIGCHLARGYFNAGNLALDARTAAQKVAHVCAPLVERTRQGRVLLMNGFDHAPPRADTAAIAAELEALTGWRVERALLDDFAAGLGGELPEFHGELVGGRDAPLLPGVWSTRVPLKLANRACETALERRSEPLAALALAHGLRDERASVRLAWRALLQNQAHDSIGGCSVDRVHAQMQARYDTARELARETSRRSLERLAGLEPTRVTPFGDGVAFELAIWNPSPFPRAGVVRVPLDPWPFTQPGEHGPAVHPWLRDAAESPGFTADGAPARVVEGDPEGRFLMIPGAAARDLELVVGEVPALGWRRVRLERAAVASPDAVDDGREIRCGETGVRVADDGTLALELGGLRFSGLAGLEDAGDRGDSYDADPIEAGPPALVAVEIERRRHANGIAELRVRRELSVPARLDPGRERRASEPARVVVETVARLAPGERGVRLALTIDNAAEDHRLRLVFPTGGSCTHALAATTFGVASRSTAPRDATGWSHPAPTTFPQQGFVAANGLCVVAPGLYEAEVRADGTIALTALRAIGWLSRPDLRTRPIAAGPTLPVPGAQLLGSLEAELVLLAEPPEDGLAAAAREAELSLLGVAAAPVATPSDRAQLELAPRALVLSAFKPAEDGHAAIVRVLNPTGSPLEARLRLGFPFTDAAHVNLDETRAPGEALRRDGDTLVFAVPAHALRSVRVALQAPGPARR